jgi:hypothetical protein
VESGEVWAIRISSFTVSQLTAVGGYRSPVFVPGGDSVLALRGADLVRITIVEPDPTVLFSLPHIVKLVGFSPNDPDNVLAVFEEDRIGLVNLSTQKVMFIEHNASGEDRDMVNSLKAWERDYGGVCLFVKPAEELGGYMDVYIRDRGCEVKNQGREVNLSRCRVFNCGQPSLSSDSKRVVFVRDLK